MGSMEAVSGLDLKLCATKAVCGLMRTDADAGVGNGRLEKLEQSVRSLEEERKKIEVFRRELPLCMRILTDVIEGLQKEMEQCREEGRYKKFPPAKREFEKEGEARAEKINWMSSAQLWSNSNNSGEPKEGRGNDEEKVLEEQQQPEKKSLFFETKSRRSTGAFVPFKGLKAHGTSVALEQKEKLSAVPGRPLLSPTKNPPLRSSTAVQDHQVFSRVVNRAPATPGAHLGLQAQQPPSRKARRCWSPELHRRFVLALKQLGGAQVATPKQIRELMKVDALTNDEVKSHLQKYRLHSQRVHTAAAAAATKFPVVTVASSWDTAPENFSSSLGQSLTQSGSPQSPLQLTSSHRQDSSEENGKSESSS